MIYKIPNKTVRENWILNGDCLNIIGDLNSNDTSEILEIEKIRVIQPWKFMPSEKTWMEINTKIYSKRPEIELHIWADTIKSDFIFLGKMTNVHLLDLNQIKFKEKETLRSMTQLKKLTLINGNVSELNFLDKLQNLKYLTLGRIRGLSNVDFISRMPNLEYLEINNQARITQLPCFQNSTLLKILRLDNLKNLIKIQNIEQLNNLQNLHFSRLNKEIYPKDFTFLKRLNKLQELYVRFNTKLKNEEFKEQILI